MSITRNMTDSHKKLLEFRNFIAKLPKDKTEKINQLLDEKGLGDIRIILNAVIDEELASFTEIPDLDPALRYEKLLHAKEILKKLIPKTLEAEEKIDHLQEKIDNEIPRVRIQKAWDHTFEVYKFGEKEKWWSYFLGVPQFRGNRRFFIFEWIIFLPPFFGCLFVPAKNIVKLFTEFFAKYIDAVCENAIENPNHSRWVKGFATVGHWIAKTWWVCLRPITSPVVSAKAALEIENIPLRITLTLLSLALSLLTMIIVMAIVPKAAFSLIGQAGGAFATFGQWVNGVTRGVPGLPPALAGVSPMNIPIILGNFGRRRLEKSTHAYLSEQLELQKIPSFEFPVVKEEKSTSPEIPPDTLNSSFSSLRPM